MADEGCENLTILTNDPSALAWAIEDSHGLGIEPGWVLAPTYVVYSDFCDLSLTDPSLCEGLVYLSEPSYSSDLSEQFHEACDNDTDCSGGIYTAHTFDAVYLMGSAMGYQDYEVGQLLGVDTVIGRGRVGGRQRLRLVHVQR